MTALGIITWIALNVHHHRHRVGSSLAGTLTNRPTSAIVVRDAT